MRSTLKACRYVQLYSCEASSTAVRPCSSSLKVEGQAIGKFCNSA